MALSLMAPLGRISRQLVGHDAASAGEVYVCPRHSGTYELVHIGSHHGTLTATGLPGTVWCASLVMVRVQCEHLPPNHRVSSWS
jgi:hypothetical protein